MGLGEGHDFLLLDKSLMHYRYNTGYKPGHEEYNLDEEAMYLNDASLKVLLLFLSV
jgi:hypothetical protein